MRIYIATFFEERLPHVRTRNVITLENNVVLYSGLNPKWLTEVPEELCRGYPLALELAHPGGSKTVIPTNFLAQETGVSPEGPEKNVIPFSSSSWGSLYPSCPNWGSDLGLLETQTCYCFFYSFP